eukprot:15359307-Ditylum_brightwellii.AAC.1
MGCLLGMGPNVMCMEVNITSITKKHEFRTPKSEGIMNCVDETVLDGMITSISRDIIVEANNKDPFELIPMEVASGKEYNATHDNEQEIKHVAAFVMWAWGVKRKDKVNKTKYAARPDNRELM